MTGNDNNGTEYRSIAVPDEKPPDEYTYAERRAEVLELIEQAGTPDAVNGAELARRYGCTRQNIYNDFDVLADYVADTVGDRADLTIQSVFKRAIRGLIDQKEYRKAAKTAADYGEWIQERHEIADIWDRLDDLEHLTEPNDPTQRD